jgi:hypothetical protein
MNTEKKQWVTPTATEIEVNGGPNGGDHEISFGTIVS